MAGRMRGLLERLLLRQRAEQHSGVPDAELLRRFAHDRDEAAFELLVWRHGAMVLGLCRRAVRDEQLAEDAFQAVFLVLARRAAAVRGNLGGWLFKVARRVSLRALKRRPVTQAVGETPAAFHPDSAERDELSSLLDAEIARLPERLRRPVVLCYLGGQSTEEAARELGIPRGTVLSRLATARKRLAERLTRRGVTLPATLTGTVVSGRLVSSATAASTAFRVGLFPASAASLLATGVLNTMSRATFLTAFGGIALAASLVGGVGWVTSDAGPKVALAAADPPKPVPPDPADARRQADERKKKLELLAESVRVEIEALEKNIDLLVRANDDTAVRAAALQRRLADLEAEITALDRELIKLEAELVVLKKRIEDTPLPHPATVETVAASDPRVMKLAAELIQAKADLARAVQLSVGEETPQVKALKQTVDALTKSADAERKRAVAAATEAVRAAEKSRLKGRITDLEEGIAIKKEVLTKLKAERDALAKTVRAGAAGALDVERLRAATQPQRELLAKLQRELLLERARREGITFTEATANDAKLDAILTELAALRKEVQELKQKK